MTLCSILYSDKEVSVLQMEGDLREDDEERLELAVKDALGFSRYVVVDLSKSRNVRTKNLGMIVTLQTYASQKQKRLLYLNPPPRFKEILRLTKLSEVLNVYDSLESLISANPDLEDTRLPDLERYAR